MDDKPKASTKGTTQVELRLRLSSSYGAAQLSSHQSIMCKTRVKSQPFEGQRFRCHTHKLASSSTELHEK